LNDEKETLDILCGGGGPGDRRGQCGHRNGPVFFGRTAAFEPRLRICITNPGVLDWGETFFTTLEEYSPEMLQMYEKNPRRLDKTLKVAGALSPFLMWGLKDTMWN
jgi:hypothetical protein